MFLLDINLVKRAPLEKAFFELQSELPPLEVEGEKLAFKGPITVSVKVAKIGVSYLVEGTAKGKLVMYCNRCLEPFSYSFEIPVSENYYPVTSEPVLEEQKEEWTPFTGEFINITNELSKSIFSLLPMKALCHQDCLGLCSKCGQNLNLTKCNCKEKEIDPRLEVLQKLLKND